jgi:hypothetical protein
LSRLPVKPRVIPSLRRRREISRRVMNHTETLWSDQLCVGEIPRRASPPRDDNTGDATDLMPLKELNRSLVFLGCGLCLKRSQIPALSRFRIFLL